MPAGSLVALALAELEDDDLLRFPVREHLAAHGHPRHGRIPDPEIRAIRVEEHGPEIDGRADLGLDEGKRKDRAALGPELITGVLEDGVHEGPPIRCDGADNNL